MEPPFLERVILSAAPVLFSFFSTGDACALRRISNLFKEAVGDSDWRDVATSVASSKIPLWRQCFSHPRAVKVMWHASSPAAHLQLLGGVQSLDFSGGAITDLLLANLPRSIRELGLRHCSHITDKGI